MHQDRREPPGGYGRISGRVAVATSFDTFRDNLTDPKKQGFGVEPFLSIGVVIVPIVKRIESLKGAQP